MLWMTVVTREATLDDSFKGRTLKFSPPQLLLFSPSQLLPFSLSSPLKDRSARNHQQTSLPHRNDPKHDLLGSKLDVIESNRILWFADDALLSSVFVHVLIYDHHTGCAQATIYDKQKRN